MALTTEVTLTSHRDDVAEKIHGRSQADGRFWKVAMQEEGKPCPPIHEKQFPWAEVLWNAWRRMRLRDHQNDLRYMTRDVKFAGIYRAGIKALGDVGFDTSTLFVTTGIVDTFTARMARRKTMPMFIVDDAEWSLKAQAQEFRRWLHGKLQEAKFDRLYPMIVRDALTRGDGMVYIDEGDEDVFVERVHRWEILLDPYEARMGPDAVRTMVRFRVVSRDSLIDRFPEYTKEIEECEPASTEKIDALAGDFLSDEREVGTRDVVEFMEAWHPPSKQPKPGEDGGGRFVACIKNATLCYCEWRDTGFPFARLPCFPDPVGYWSCGVVERLRELQAGIDRIVADIDMNVRVTGKGIWTVPEQFDIPVEKLSGYRPFKLTYKGPRPPQFEHPVPFSPQQLQLLQFKIDQAHNLVGSAQWSAQGRSPLGAGASGVAIDTMEDLLSDRHAVLEESCAHFRLDVAQGLLDAAGRVAERMEEHEEEMAGVEDEDEGEEEDEYGEAEHKPAKKTMKMVKKKSPFYATWMDKGRLERLDWHTVSMQKEQYRLQLEPVGFMPSTRAGKLAATAELVKTGVIQQNQAMNLYDEPDLAHINRLLLAPQHNNERMCEIVGDPTKPMPQPNEMHDLNGLLAMAKQYANRAENEMSRSQDRAMKQRVWMRYLDFTDRIIATQDILARRQAEKDAQMRRDAEAALPPPGGAGGMPGAMPQGPMPGMEQGMPPPGMGAPGPGMMPPGAAALPMA